ncbi:MAG: hypothetical protein ACRYFS_00150 [Janthinobacterium lividum]
MTLSLSTCLLTGTLLLIAVCPVTAQTLPPVPTPTPAPPVDSPPAPRTETLRLKFTVG